MAKFMPLEDSVHMFPADIIVLQVVLLILPKVHTAIQLRSMIL